MTTSVAAIAHRADEWNGMIMIHRLCLCTFAGQQATAATATTRGAKWEHDTLVSESHAHGERCRTVRVCHVAATNNQLEPFDYNYHSVNADCGDGRRRDALSQTPAAPNTALEPCIGIVLEVCPLDIARLANRGCRAGARDAKWCIQWAHH